MLSALLVSNIVLWVLVLSLAFLLLGALRGQSVLYWKLEELEMTTPNRAGRTGLKPGQPAPPFTLAKVGGGEASLQDFAGTPVLLVFVQAGCAPCHAVVPELNRIARTNALQVVVINNAEP